MVSLPVQESLFDHAERRHLSHGAWVEVRAGWLDASNPPEAASLFDDLLAAVPWRAERRQMYDRVTTVPRPEIENTSSIGIRNGLSMARTGSGM